MGPAVYSQAHTHALCVGGCAVARAVTVTGAVTGAVAAAVAVTIRMICCTAAAVRKRKEVRFGKWCWNCR